MSARPASIERFLAGSRLAVAGVSRQGRQPANAIFERLRRSGREVFPVNPRAERVAGVPCYRDVASLPRPIDGLVVAAPPEAGLDLVRQAAEIGVRSVWFHRSFGQGSVSDEAVEECRRLDMEVIVGGCPMMFCEPVDVGHRCMRWWLQRRGRVPR